MKKKVIIIFILLLLFGIIGGLLYLNNVYLPTQIKARIIAGLSSSLNYDADISTIHYNPFKGLVINDIFIYDKVKNQENTILYVKEARFNVLLLPFFKEGKVIIPVLHIDEPAINIHYHKDQTFNFSRALSRVDDNKQPKKQNGKFQLLIYKIKLFGGKISFKDERFDAPFTKEIQDVDIGLTLRPLTKVAFLAKAKLLNENKPFGKFSLQGNYDFASKALNLKTDLTNIEIADFKAYLTNLPFAIAKGSIPASALNLSLKENIINLDCTLDAAGLEVRKGTLTLNTGLQISGKYLYDLAKKETDYAAVIELKEAQLTGIKYVDKMSGIFGKVNLIKNKVTTEGLKLRGLNSDIILNGELTDFVNPQVKLEFRSAALDLETAFPALTKWKNWKVTGVAQASYSLSGLLNKPPLGIKAVFDITNATVKTPALKDTLNNLQGKIEIVNDGVNWKNLNFDYRTTAYNASGAMKNFREPEFNFNLTSKDLNLEGTLLVKDKIITIGNLTAKSAESTLTLSGTVNAQNKDNPLLDLKLKSHLNIRDTLKFLPATTSEKINKMKLDSTLNLSGSVGGKAKDVKELAVNLQANANNFSIYGLKFNNLSFKLTQENRELLVPRIILNGYSGTISLGVNAELKPQSTDYKLSVLVSGIDLNKLKMDTDFKDKEISGILNIAGNLSGDMKKLETMKGTASVSVENGNLWQINLFKGLGEFFLMPEYRNVAFEEASGDFDIADKTVTTENLNLKSQPMTLLATGQCTFDGGLDFTVYSKMNKGLIRDSADIRKFTTAIFGELHNAVAVKVTGTLQKPKYSLLAAPLELFKSIKNFLLGKD